jgi:hypothetical protein
MVLNAALTHQTDTSRFQNTGRLNSAGDSRTLARNLAEVIDDVYAVPRDRERRLALIQVQLLRAMQIARRSQQRRAP